MNDKDYVGKWFNVSHGLELKPDVNNKGVRVTTENGKLSDVQYKLLQRMKGIGPSTHELYMTNAMLKRNRSYRADGETQVDGLFDRGEKESINGSPFQRSNEHRIRTISRDEMQAICTFSVVFGDIIKGSKGKMATDIANMAIKSFGRFPNHEVESLYSIKELLKPVAWKNIQLQPADYVFYMLMSNNKLHNLIGLLLFPIYFISQFSTPSTKHVTRPTKFDAYFDKKEGRFIGYQTLPANSGDCLFFVRHEGLKAKYGSIYEKVMSPVISMYKKKWGEVWYANALYEYFDWRLVEHDYPTISLLKENYDIKERYIPIEFDESDPRYEEYMIRRKKKYGEV